MINKISVPLIFIYLLLLFIDAGSTPLRRVFTNGKIIVGNGDGVAETVVIEGKRILFVGTDRAGEKYQKGKNITTTDLKGKVVIPGFHDGELDFLIGAGLFGNKLNFYGLNLESIIHRLKNEKKNTKNKIIYGYNFEHLFSNAEKWPNRYDLDKVSVDSPVVVFSSDGNNAWINSFTLKQFSINRDTPEVAGGRIVRFENNSPSGILIGKAIDILEGYSFRKSIKKIRPDKEKIIKAIKYANRFGLTSVTTYGDLEFVKQLEVLESEQKLNLRFNIILPSENIGRYLVSKVGFSSGSPHLRIISVTKKIDGNLYSLTAAMFSEYKNTGNYGFLTTNINDISDLVSLYRQNGITANFNAEGDRGVHSVLNGIRDATKRSSKFFQRYRISNFHFIIDEDIKRLKKMNVIPVMRIASLIDRAALIEKLVGPRKAGNVMKAGTLHTMDIKIAFGSGWPGGSINPLKGIGFAVFRRIKERRNKEYRWFIEEKLSFADAIRNYTYTPSYSVSDEARTGSIEKGKFADIVILNGNIFSEDFTEKEFFSNVRVIETIVAGKTVFKEEVSN